MKRVSAALFLLVFIPAVPFARDKKSGSYYEAIIYHYNAASQETIIDNYLEKVLVPALHSHGLKAGIFKPLANDTAADKKTYVIIDHKSWQSVLDDRKQVNTDIALSGEAKSFTGTAYNAPAFSRKEIILMEAFPMMTFLKEPSLRSPKADHIYEWRSYESPTEDLHLNKVKMFNEGGEVALFARLNFNAVFYSAVIAGSRMPNLIYLTSFENMDDRNAHWKTFGADEEWKKLSSMPEYQNNVSRSDIILMKALPFSDY